MPSKELLNGKRPTTQTHRRECSSLWLQITFKHATCKLTAMNYNNKASGKQAKKESVVEFKNKNVEKQQELLTTYTQTILVCLQKINACLCNTNNNYNCNLQTHSWAFLLFLFHLLFFYNRQIEKYNFPVELLNSDKRRQQLCALPNSHTHTHTQKRGKARQCNWKMRLQRQCHGC